MQPSLMSSEAALVVLVVALVAALAWRLRPRGDGKRRPPQPWKLPILGHLHLMSGHEVPYQAFRALGSRLGNVFRLQLGSVPCVVVNGQKGIREALVTKGHHFDSRPNFQRYQQLFAGNKENSLAFCDWSSTQKTRRDMLKAHTFPRAFTERFHSLDGLILEGTLSMINEISPGASTAIKPIVLRACANIFTQHFCSVSFGPQDSAFLEMVSSYDHIFYEVNQGYAADFLPFLLPLHRRNLERITGFTHNIRNFVLEHLIGSRYESLDLEEAPLDYVDTLIHHVKGGQSPELTWDSALYALEDIIGGHSAVGNFLVKLLAFIAKEPEAQAAIQKEIDDAVGAEPVGVSHRALLPRVEAAILEAVRLIASPIVPRVANCDSSIEGFHIDKGTVIFLNNYDLSMSHDLWQEPEKFNLERFIVDGRIVKPDHFLPFGGGRRSCMGYKMVQLVSFGMLGGLLQRFTVVPTASDKVPVGSLALPEHTFEFNFVPRS